MRATWPPASRAVRSAPRRAGPALDMDVADDVAGADHDRRRHRHHPPAVDAYRGVRRAPAGSSPAPGCSCSDNSSSMRDSAAAGSAGVKSQAPFSGGRCGAHAFGASSRSAWVSTCRRASASTRTVPIPSAGHHPARVFGHARHRERRVAIRPGAAAGLRQRRDGNSAGPPGRRPPSSASRPRDLIGASAAGRARVASGGRQLSTATSARPSPDREPRATGDAIATAHHQRRGRERLEYDGRLGSSSRLAATTIGAGPAPELRRSACAWSAVLEVGAGAGRMGSANLPRRRTGEAPPGRAGLHGRSGRRGDRRYDARGCLTRMSRST